MCAGRLQCKVPPTNRIAKRRARAVDGDSRHLRRRQARPLQGGSDQRLLGGAVGRRQAAGPPILAHRRALRKAELASSTSF